MELFAERKKIDRSDSAPAPDISVNRSAQLHSWSGACSEERPLRSRSCPSLISAIDCVASSHAIGGPDHHFQGGKSTFSLKNTCFRDAFLRVPAKNFLEGERERLPPPMVQMK